MCEDNLDELTKWFIGNSKEIISGTFKVNENTALKKSDLEKIIKNMKEAQYVDEELENKLDKVIRLMEELDD